MRYVAYTNVSISPVISFTIWALTDRSNNGSGLTSSQAFTSLTLFTLLATPISTLVEAAAGVATAVGSIERINTFLYTTSRQDDRAPSLQQSSAGSSEPEKSRQSGTDIESSNSEDIVATSVVKVSDGCGDNKSIIGSTVILAKDLTAGWSEKEPVSAGPLSIVVHRSTLTMIVGPVGCGKSTILRSMLAETKIHDGTLIVPNRTIAYCSQTPWLTNSTLQSNILGESLYDMTWYDTVIKACALDKDIKDIPLGDQTLVGTQGAVLSGGQKQRVVSYFRPSTMKQ
jgi:ATP-binding cassette, subfamily C (CFTR/MRP), member 1